jgi:hypothetical protein
MAGTPQDPFLETVADCNVCLDLKKAHLRWKRRKFGRVGPVYVPYRFTLKRLNQNVERRGCKGCILIQQAAQTICDELTEAAKNAQSPEAAVSHHVNNVEPGTQTLTIYDQLSMETVNFRNARLEYLDKDGLGRLSLGLSVLYPKDATEAMWRFALWRRDVTTEVYTGPSKVDMDRAWEHRIASPEYEIYRTSPVSCTKDAQNWDSIQVNTQRCGNTRSDEAVWWALSRLDACQNDHSLCNLAQDSLTLPSRVIDLGENLQDYKADPRLLVTGARQGDYICLSHCWDTPDVAPLETTRDNFPSHHRTITFGALPKTFRDSIIFTRKLGVRFLWIDSLYIIQNNADDWLREAGQMASMYQNAKLTLAAAASANSRGGLFRVSNPGTRLDSGGGTGSEPLGGIFIRKFSRKFSDPTFFHHRLAKDAHDARLVSPLLKRA